MRDPDDYGCRCRLEGCSGNGEPDPPRDFFAEAIQLAAGDESFNIEGRHLIAVVHKLRELGIVIRGMRRMLQDPDVARILSACEAAVPLDCRAIALANFRDQAKSVTGPQKAELLESMRTAERAALDQPRPFQALVNDPTFIRRP